MTTLTSKKILANTLVMLMIITITVLSCSKSDNGGSTSATTPPATGNAVSITGMQFSAASLTATAGATITWTNNDNMNHTVTADDNSFDSGTIAPGGKYTRTFTTAGSYAYHCSFHAAMKGTVIVK